MLKKVSLLLFTFLYNHQELAWTETSSSYIARVKKNHSAKRAVQILSKRLALETSKQTMNSEMVFICLIAIKDLDPATYKIELSKIATLLSQTLKEPTVSPTQTENVFNFISQMSSKSSVEDGFYLMEQLGTSYLIEASRLYSDVLLQMKPELYIKYFDSKFEAIKSQPQKFKILVEFYCVSTVLTGKVEKCGEKITALKSQLKAEPWASALELIVKMNLLDIDGASQYLKIFDPNCPSNTDFPWTNFHLARLYRVQKNIEKSLSCLRSFKNDTKDTPGSLLFYNLEHGKTLRFVDIKKSDLAFEEADAFNKNSKNPFSYFELIVEIEKTKNAIINKDTQNTKKYLARLKTHYKIDELQQYVELIQWLEAYSANPEQPRSKNSNNFEIYDFSIFVDSLNKKTKKTN